MPCSSRGPGSLARPWTGDLGTATVYFDSVREDSTLARDRVADALTEYRRSLLGAREQARQLPAGFTRAVDVLRRDVAPPSRRAGYVLGAFLPFLLVSLSLFGGFYAAVDLTAGEKERGTMQTLMCAPLRSAEIVVGKFLAVWTVATGGRRRQRHQPRAHDAAHPARRRLRPRPLVVRAWPR